MLKQPSAWIPIALSLTMLASIIIVLTLSGAPGSREEDEGVGAHLFQLWLLLELFLVAFFGVKWSPQRPPQALAVLALQIIAIAAACFPVFYFKF